MISITHLETGKVYHAGNLSQSIYFKGLSGLSAKKERFFFSRKSSLLDRQGE